MGIVTNDLLASCTSDASGIDVCCRVLQQHAHLPNHAVDRAQRELAEAALGDWESRTGAAGGAGDVFGEAKRVLIARALVHKPRALLFDEPCNSLDIAAQHGLRETMRELANSGIGIILVTHELADIVQEIERVVLMSNGRIVADGHKDDVLQEETLSRVFGVEVKLDRHEGYYRIW